MQAEQVGVEVRCHVTRGNGGRQRVLRAGADQRGVPVNGESLVFVDDQGALGAAARLRLG